jgi:hypothetical protein
MQFECTTPFTITEAEVSSQEDSMARMIISLGICIEMEHANLLDKNKRFYKKEVLFTG